MLLLCELGAALSPSLAEFIVFQTIFYSFVGASAASSPAPRSALRTWLACEALSSLHPLSFLSSRFVASFEKIDSSSNALLFNALQPTLFARS